MFLSRTDIDVIIHEINKTSKNKKLIETLESFSDKRFINFITSSKYILNSLPKTVTRHYIQYFRGYSRQILSFCSINDMQILSALIDECLKTNIDTEEIAKKSLLLSDFPSDFLYKQFPNFYTDKIVLNTKPNEAFLECIYKKKYFLTLVTPEFFEHYTMSKKFMHKVSWQITFPGFEEFYDMLNVAINKGVAKIEPDALTYCIRDQTARSLAWYNIPDYKLSRRIVARVKNDSEAMKAVASRHNIPIRKAIKVLGMDNLHYYIAHNKSCSDSDIINFHKKMPKLNWIYINSNLNMSKHQEYAKYLANNDLLDVVEYSLKYSIERNEEFSNINILSLIGVKNSIIRDILKTRISEFDVGIHSGL